VILFVAGHAETGPLPGWSSRRAEVYTALLLLQLARWLSTARGCTEPTGRQSRGCCNASSGGPIRSDVLVGQIQK
jgi:hypothetical protein